MYIPKNQIVVSQYIGMGKLVYKSNQNSYSGYYHIINGYYYIGSHPQRYPIQLELVDKKEIKVNSLVVNKNEIPNSIRYIMYNSTTSIIKEISFDVWSTLSMDNKKQVYVINFNKPQFQFDIDINRIERDIPLIKNYLNLNS